MEANKQFDIVNKIFSENEEMFSFSHLVTWSDEKYLAEELEGSTKDCM